MSALLQIDQQLYLSPIEKEIRLHSAWLGYISGLKAEKMLSEQDYKVPYTYLLRQGEGERDFYVTFIRPDLTIQHQPFIVKITPEGWYCLNGVGNGPFIHTSIDTVIHFVMHCKQNECIPYCL